MKQGHSIHCTNYQWALEHFCPAPACSRGFIRFSADRCREEAFRLISCPHRVRGRETGSERESLSVHMFIHSPRILFCMPTRSSLQLFRLPPTLPRSLLCHWFTGYYLLVFGAAAGTLAESNSSLRLMLRKTACIRVFASTLQGPLFQLSDTKRILHA